MRTNVIRNGAAIALWLGMSLLYSGPAQAVINDHRSPDNTCQGKPEPPTPEKTICERKICTNDGDWMCCNLCTRSGGYCCNLMESTQQTGTTTLSTPKFPRSESERKTPIMRRGLEGEQGAEPASGTVPSDEPAPSGGTTK